MKKEDCLGQWAQYVNDNAWSALVDEIETYYDDTTGKYRCTPNKDQIFQAFQLCPPQDIRVIFIGNDPYPNIDSAGNAIVSPAEGIAFSHNSNINLQASMKGLQDVINVSNGYLSKGSFGPDLSSFAKNNVLLINSKLIYVSKQNNNIWEQVDLNVDVWKNFFNEIQKGFPKGHDIGVVIFGDVAKGICVIDYNQHKNCKIAKVVHPSSEDWSNYVNDKTNILITPSYKTHKACVDIIKTEFKKIQ